MDYETVRHMFIVGLRDVHAVEHQAFGIMDRQIERLAQYAEVEARLRAHRGEAGRQIKRIEEETMPLVIRRFLEMRSEGEQASH
jgi:ferritin-like metal-binding protein YciE